MSKTQVNPITFYIDFYNSSDKHIDSSTLEAPDYWDACLQGHAILFGGTVPNAVEFNLTEQRMAA